MSGCPLARAGAAGATVRGGARTGEDDERAVGLFAGEPVFLDTDSTTAASPATATTSAAVATTRQPKERCGTGRGFLTPSLPTSPEGPRHQRAPRRGRDGRRRRTRR